LQRSQNSESLLAYLPTSLPSNKYRIYCPGTREVPLTVTPETHALKKSTLSRFTAGPAFFRLEVSPDLFPNPFFSGFGFRRHRDAKWCNPQWFTRSQRNGAPNFCLMSFGHN